MYIMTHFERKRLATGMTQQELGNQLGVDRSTVSRWESGDCIPEARHFPRLAEIFGMTPEEVTHLFDAAPAAPASSNAA